MHIMTEQGWRSLGGFAERIKREATARQEREDAAREAYRTALVTPPLNTSDDAHREKHARCNQLFAALMAA